MCDPITVSTALAIGSFAVSAGSAVLNKKAQDKAASENKTAALEDKRISQYDASIRQQEEMTSGRRAIEAGMRQGREAKAAARASAGEAGVTGMSVDMLLGDIDRDQAAYTQSIEDQTVVTLDQLQRIKQGAGALAQNRINAVQPGSWLSTGVQVAGAGVDLYSTLRLRRPPGTI